MIKKISVNVNEFLCQGSKAMLTRVEPAGTQVKPAGGAACEPAAIAGGKCTDTFKEGVAKFCVRHGAGFDPVRNPYITLNFNIDFSGYSWWQKLLYMSPRNVFTSKATVLLRVCNNSNVTLGEVLKGEAVFVFDDTTDTNRHGAYRISNKESKIRALSRPSKPELDKVPHTKVFIS